MHIGIPDLAHRLAAIGTARHPDYPALLRPGLSREAQQARLAAADFGLHPPAEWFALYGWHDGTEEGDFDSLFHYHRFMSLDESLAIWREWKDWYEEDEKLWREAAGYWKSTAVEKLGRVIKLAPSSGA